MSDDAEIAGAPDPAFVRQPLPPEIPMHRPPVQPELDPDPVGAAPEEEDWWRKPAPAPENPAARTEPGADGPQGGHGSGSGAADGEPGQERWRWSDVRGEWEDTWSTHSQDGIAAAHEIGAHIGDAIAAHLPDPRPAIMKRIPDTRWLKLKYNVPALLISLLVTWRSHTSVDRMASYVGENGIFAPIGVVLLFALVLGLLMVLPIGSFLASAFSGLVAVTVAGLIRLTVKAWSAPYIGYLLRLAVAVAAWSFAIAVVRAIWRGAVHFLTGA